jgi:hypothetical protein
MRCALPTRGSDLGGWQLLHVKLRSALRWHDAPEDEFAVTVFEIFLSTSALLAVPALASRFKVEPRPVALAAIWSVVLAALIVLTVLTMCAAALLRSVDSSEGGFAPRHLVPAVPFTGWISLVVVALAILSGLSALCATIRRRRALRDHLRYAPMTVIDNVAVATIPTDQFLAVVAPGSGGCVVISSGALQCMSHRAIRAVVHHEESHRRHGHHRHLLLARIIDRSLWFVPGMCRATSALRDSLEDVADADALKLVGAASLEYARAGACQAASTSGRTIALTPRAGTRMALAALSVGIAIVSSAAVFLEMTWLGIGR